MHSLSPKPPDDKRHHILDAAQRRFSCFAFSKVNMEEIAADMGFSKALLYYYFATKEDLFRAVIAREQSEFIDRMEHILRQTIPAASKLKKYILTQLSLLHELGTLRILNQQAEQELRPILSDLFKAFAREELRLMLCIMKEGKRNAEFSIASVEKTAALLIHLLQGLRFRLIKLFPEHSSDIQTRYRIMKSEFQLLAQLLCAGLQTTPNTDDGNKKE